MESTDIVRAHVKSMLSWHAAHADLDRAVKNVPTEMRGAAADALPYSLWQLLEHIRLAQADILGYCLDATYESPDWPDDFWPAEAVPPHREAWQESIDTIRRDRQQLMHLADTVDLDARVPHSDEHTYLRELLLAADHAAYHIGQIVLIRRILGIWPP